MKQLMCAVAAFALALGLQAKTCTWTGGGAAGSWADPVNWGNVTPESGDSLTIENTAGETLSLVNDLADDFQIASLTLSGTGPVTISGKVINFPTNDKVVLTVGCAVTIDADIQFAAPSGSALAKGKVWLSSGTLVLNGKVAGEGMTALYLDLDTTVADAVTANGDILFPQGDVSFKGYNNNSEFHIYGRVVASSFNSQVNSTLRGKIYLCHADNDIGTIIMSLKNCYISAENALGTNACVSGGYNEMSTYIIDGSYDQVIDRFVENPKYLTPTKGQGFYPSSGNHMTLTMRAKGEGVCTMILHNDLDLVWDPLDDYTLTFTRPFDHWLSGSFDVRRGAVKTTAAATFKSLTSLTLEAGSTFEMTGGSTSALAGLSGLTLGCNAVFTLGESEVTPFTANKTTVNIAEGATLSLGADVSTAVKVFYKGQPQAAGTYCREGSTSGEHPVPWITGEGVLTVADVADNYWTGPAEGNWNVAGNWSKGVPGTQYANFVTRHGDTAIALSEDAAEVKHFTMNNLAGTTTLDVTAKAVFKSGVLELGKGAKVKVGEGGSLVYDPSGYASNITTPTLTLADNARIEVNGGDAVFTNLNGKVRIGGGDASVTSVLSVVSGHCMLHAARNNSFELTTGGRVEMTGGLLEYYYWANNNNAEYLFPMTGGEIDLSGTAELRLHLGQFKRVFGTGTVRVRGQAKITRRKVSQDRCYLAPTTEGGTLAFTVEDDGSVDLSNADRTYFGQLSAVGGKTVVEVQDRGRLLFGYSTQIGSGPGGYAEITVRDNGYVGKDHGNYGISVGAEGSDVMVAEGVLRVQGGAFNVCECADANYPTLRGLVIGNGAAEDAALTGVVKNRGLLELSGGVVSNANDRNWFVVGVGDAEGKVIQSGGLLLAGYNKQTHIGWHGGTGTYEITGGTANFGSQRVWVGGNDGTGLLALGAGNGLVKASALSLVGEKATLKFVLGADGAVSKLQVTNDLNVQNGAKLVIDATAYCGNGKVSLATYGSTDGTFAEEDIEVLPPAGKHADDFKVVQGSKSLTFRAVTGLLLMVR